MASSKHEEIATSAHAKTPFEHLNDVLAQLKEMRHYAKNNVETLTAQWLLFGGEFKKLGPTGPIETLLTRQSELPDALDNETNALEKLAATLQTPPEEAAATA